MSSVAPSPRLGWRLLPGVLAAAASVVAASLLLAAIGDRPTVVSAGRPAPAPAVAVPVVTTPWRTVAFSVGTGGSLSKPERARLAAQKPRARRVALEIGHGVTLGSPERLTALRGLLTPAAARSVRDAAPGLPNDATDVVVLRRSIRMGLQAPRFDTAVAHVEVKAKALVKQRRVRWVDGVTLWLAREDNKWKAIAFDIKREPR